MKERETLILLQAQIEKNDQKILNLNPLLKPTVASISICFERPFKAVLLLRSAAFLQALFFVVVCHFGKNCSLL